VLYFFFYIIYQTLVNGTRVNYNPWVVFSLDDFIKKGFSIRYLLNLLTVYKFNKKNVFKFNSRYVKCFSYEWALKSPMSEHTHVERPFQLNQYLERVLSRSSINGKLLERVYNHDLLSKPFENKIILLSILFNIKKQNYKSDYFIRTEDSLYIASNPRIKSEEPHFYRLIRSFDYNPQDLINSNFKFN